MPANSDIVGREITLGTTRWQIARTAEWSDGYVVIRREKRATAGRRPEVVELLRPAAVIRRALQIDDALAAAGVTDSKTIVTTRARIEDGDASLDVVVEQLKLDAA